MLTYIDVKVARTYLFAGWLAFLKGFFGRNESTFLYEFCHP